jgi:dihydroxyacid dehydratase/phosphogluconate dehydratase
MTVNGKTLGENIEGAEVYNDDVIRPLANPIYAKARWPCCAATWRPTAA